MISIGRDNKLLRCSSPGFVSPNFARPFCGSGLQCSRVIIPREGPQKRPYLRKSHSPAMIFGFGKSKPARGQSVKGKGRGSSGTNPYRALGVGEDA